MAKGGGEAELFRTARIGVLWNMDMCPISPAFSDATQIAPQIKSSLLIMGYEEEVAIGAIGDTRKLSSNILRGLRATGIIVEHSGGDEHLNYEATAHLYAWALHKYISKGDESVKDLLILGKTEAARCYSELFMGFLRHCGDTTYRPGVILQQYVHGIGM